MISFFIVFKVILININMSYGYIMMFIGVNEVYSVFFDFVIYRFKLYFFFKDSGGNFCLFFWIWLYFLKVIRVFCLFVI